MPTLHIRSDQRFGAIGRTQCGKTFLMAHMLEAQEHVIVVDSKHRVEIPGFSLTYDWRSAANLAVKKVIYRHRGPIPNDFWMRATQSLHDAGGGVLYVDEAPVITGPNSIANGLADAIRLGAELGVGVWWSGQEATGVNNTLIRQSDVIALFHNSGASDRDKLIQTCGDMGEATLALQPFQFMLFESGGKTYDANNIPVYQVKA
jgi:hypothetical protein